MIRNGKSKIEFRRKFRYLPAAKEYNFISLLHLQVAFRDEQVNAPTRNRNKNKAEMPNICVSAKKNTTYRLLLIRLRFLPVHTSDGRCINTRSKVVNRMRTLRNK